MEVNRFNLFLSSDHATSGPISSNGLYPANNNLIYLVNPPQKLKNPENFYTCEILNICLPFSFNQINPSNNVIINNYLQVNSGAINNFNITVTPGNYNIEQFCIIMTQLFQNEYNILYPTGTAKIIFQIYNLNAGLCSVQITDVGIDNTLMFLNFGYNMLSLGNSYLADIIGFKTNLSIVSNATPTISQAYLNANPISQIVCRSQSLSGYSFEFLGKPRADGRGICKQSTIIGNFNLLTTPGSYLNSTNIVPLKTRIKNNQINSVDITFYSDDSEIPIDFAGSVYFMNISITEYQTTGVDFNLQNEISLLREVLKTLNESILKLNTTKSIEKTPLITQSSEIPTQSSEIPTQSSEIPTNSDSSFEKQVNPEEIRKNLEIALLELKSFNTQ